MLSYLFTWAEASRYQKGRFNELFVNNMKTDPQFQNDLEAWINIGHPKAPWSHENPYLRPHASHKTSTLAPRSRHYAYHTRSWDHTLITADIGTKYTFISQNAIEHVAATPEKAKPAEPQRRNGNR
ncbi:hypothetical protein ABVK25_001737 [Lepraria finkii]|uniref:Uncharacterized protein n=1 Tax=Lepraria finkii TaxID=1340010 RepID=A0ABR4BJX5_9LECA